MRGNGVKKSAALWAAFVVVIVAIWLRARGVAQHPLWLDEAYSAFAAEKGYAFIWHVLPTYETHPPLYSTLVRTWSFLAGSSLFGYRSFGLVTGIAVLPVIWMAARELALLLNRPVMAVALPALMLAAVSPPLVEASRNVRPYHLMCLTYACSIWAVLALTRHHSDAGKLKRAAWLVYLASIALLFWLHNLGALYVAGIGLALLVMVGPATMMRDHRREFFLGHALVALAALPAILIGADQAPQWIGSTWLRFEPTALLDSILLIFGLPALFGLAVATFLTGVAFWQGATRRNVLAALFIAAVTPIFLAIVVSLTVAPVFLPRTLTASAMPLLLLIAAGASYNLLSRVFFAMLLAVVLARVVMTQQLPPAEDWHGAARWLSTRMAPGDRIYAYPNEGALPLSFAMRDLRIGGRIRQVPSEIPAHDPAGWYPTGSRGVQSLPAWRLKQIANDRESLVTPTIWLMRLRKHDYDKGNAFEKALRRDRREAGRFAHNDIEILGLTLPPPPPRQP